MTVPTNAGGGGIARGPSDPNPTLWQPDDINSLLAGGGVAKASTGQALRIDVTARKKLWAGVEQTWNALTNQAVTDNATNYVYLDLANYGSSQDPTIATSLPATSVDAFILAKVTASGGAITEVASIQELWPEMVFTDADNTKLDGIEAGADVTDATNVAAAGAVMDSDFSGSDAGHMIRTGAATYSVLKHNLSATAAPTTGDDTGDGYAVGSLWIDVTNDKVYRCVDATASAAVWKDLTETPGKVAQELTDTSDTEGTTTSVIPIDDTLPGSAEGAEILSLDLTPTDSGSTIILEVALFAYINNSFQAASASILDDGTCVAAQQTYAADANATLPICFKAVIPSIGDTNEHTFSVRVGPSNAAATVTYMGYNGAARFAGAQKAVLLAREILP